MPSSRGSSQPRDPTPSLMSPVLAGRFFTTSTTWVRVCKQGLQRDCKDGGRAFLLPVFLLLLSASLQQWPLSDSHSWFWSAVSLGALGTSPWACSQNVSSSGVIPPSEMWAPSLWGTLWASELWLFQPLPWTAAAPVAVDQSYRGDPVGPFSLLPSGKPIPRSNFMLKIPPVLFVLFLDPDIYIIPIHLKICYKGTEEY